MKREFEQASSYLWFWFSILRLFLHDYKIISRYIDIQRHYLEKVSCFFLAAEGMKRASVLRSWRISTSFPPALVLDTPSYFCTGPNCLHFFIIAPGNCQGHMWDESNGVKEKNYWTRTLWLHRLWNPPASLVHYVNVWRWCTRSGKILISAVTICFPGLINLLRLLYWHSLDCKQTNAI